MSLLERGTTLAVEIEKTLPVFIAYMQNPGSQQLIGSQQIVSILGKVRRYPLSATLRL